MKEALFLLPLLILISLQSIQLVNAQGLIQVPCPGNLSGTCLHLPTATPTPFRAAPASQHASVQQQHCWTVPYPNGSCPVPSPVPGTPAPACPDGSTPDSNGYCNNSTQTQSFIGQDFGDLRNVTAGLVNLQTGILHNEQGVFIPWSKICTQGQGLLVQSCSSLVNSDGTLTPAGDRAVGCIRNGLAAGIAATKVGLSFNLTKSLLGGLAGPLGCGGIVDMNKIQNSNEFLRSVGK